MDKNPFNIFKEWYAQAAKEAKVADHTEFCLATADIMGVPSARIVLLKKFDERGFVFFTNYQGRKSCEMNENPVAAMCFYWNALGKQIRIEGKVEMISGAESDEYFVTRPRESQIGARASKQSQKLESREEFLAAVKDIENKFEDIDITRPDNWGGWRIIPEAFEFWEAEKFRYHRREVFKKNKNSAWEEMLLYP